MAESEEDVETQRIELSRVRNKLIPEQDFATQEKLTGFKRITYSIKIVILASKINILLIFVPICFIAMMAQASSGKQF